MDSKGWVFFNVLINRYQENAGTFLSTLPKETLEALKQNAVQSLETTAALRFPSQFLTHIHFSWFIPVINQASTSLKPLYLSCLSPAQRQGICRQLKMPLPKFKVSLRSRLFLQNQLARQLEVTKALPLEYLSASPLTTLATLSKEKLVLLIDYLGLRDLAEALRPIVDNRLLQAIHRCLKPPEMQLLRAYLHQRDSVKAVKLDLAKWNGQRDSLRLLYHQRGLARLAKALSGQSEDLIWHISRHLDEKRASLLVGLGMTKVASAVTQKLILQVIAILEFLQRQTGE